MVALGAGDTEGVAVSCGCPEALTATMPKKHSLRDTQLHNHGILPLQGHRLLPGEKSSSGNCPKTTDLMNGPA